MFKANETNVEELPPLVINAGAVMDVPCPRVAQVWVGDEPVAILMAAHSNELIGIAAKAWSCGVDRLLSRLIEAAEGDDADFCRAVELESMLAFGYVYLTRAAAEDLTRGSRNRRRELRDQILEALYFAPMEVAK